MISARNLIAGLFHILHSINRRQRKKLLNILNIFGLIPPIPFVSLRKTNNHYGIKRHYLSSRNERTF